MAGKSLAFGRFCKDAFGEDFSQDGFSDMKQVERIIDLIPAGDDVHVLDIGCGNGKMLRYLQRRTGIFIHGFDYSGNAIKAAKEMSGEKADFRQGAMGETEYPPESFDVITSMDTIYFAPDMEKFLLHAIGWLKKNGVMIIFYQEGDVMPKTDGPGATILAKSLQKTGIRYESENITEETYDLLKKKRQTALRYRKDFEEEGNADWFELLLLQTDCVTGSFEQFAQKMARYIYIIRK